MKALFLTFDENGSCYVTCVATVQAISCGYNNSIPYLLNVFTGGVHVG